MNEHPYRDDEVVKVERLLLKPFILFWLIITTAPFVYDLVQLGPKFIYSTIKTCQAIYVLFILVCVIGFQARKDWARRQIRSLVCVQLIMIIYCLIYLSNIPYEYLLNEWELTASMEHSLIKKYIIWASIALVLFPFYIVFYLSHPNIRNYFQQPKKEEEEEDEEEDEEEEDDTTRLEYEEKNE